MQRSYNFEFYNNKPSGGNFNLYGDFTRLNNVFTQGTDEWLNKAFPLTDGISYSKVLLMNIDDFIQMQSLKENETMYDIRFTPISYLQYMQLVETFEKISKMPIKSEIEMIDLIKKYAPINCGGTVMGKEDILNLYTKPYGFKCVEKSSLSNACNTKITTLIGKNLFNNTVEIANSAIKDIGMCNFTLKIEKFDDNYTFYNYEDDVNYRNSYTKTK